jgi:hypothetical protein
MGKSELALPQPKSWHSLKVRILGEKVIVSVKQQPPVEFTLSWLAKHDPPAAENLSATGAVGIWAKSGRGLFRNATIMLLPSE